MFTVTELQGLQAARARADGVLQAVVFCLLTHHEAGHDVSAGDWLRLRRAYYALEDASVAVRDYLMKSEMVQ
jgi:hypothetical protein